MRSKDLDASEERLQDFRTFQEVFAQIPDDHTPPCPTCGGSERIPAIDGKGQKERPCPACRPDDYDMAHRR